jgi:hypothetical protein
MYRLKKLKKKVAKAQRALEPYIERIRTPRKN